MAHRTWLTICRAVRSGANNFSMMAVSLMSQYTPIRNQKPPISPRRLSVAAGSWAFAGALAPAGTGSGRSANEIGSGPLKFVRPRTPCPGASCAPCDGKRQVHPSSLSASAGHRFRRGAFRQWSSAWLRAAGFDMKIYPHMLRHACGYKLANEGVDTRTIQGYLGHKSIQHTVRYTELA